MFFVSFIICIILSVHTIQPIHGASNAEKAVVPQTKGQSAETIFSEGGSFTISKTPTRASNESLHPVKAVEQSLVNSETKEAKRHRGITNTDDAPSISELHSNNTKNSLISSSKNTAINNTTATVNQSPSSNSSQTASKVEPTLLSSMQNTQNTKTDNTKINPPSPNASKTTATVTTNGTSSTTTTTTTTTTSTTTTTKKPTTTTTTTTTMKAPPKKPLITQSVEDVPGLLKAAEAQSQSQSTKDQPLEDVRDNEPLSLQSSETISYPDQKSSHNFTMLIVGVLVIIPFLVLLTNYAVRRVRDYWSKRRYRRMDYLIEDMYN